MNNNLNTLWCLTINNFCSYDSLEQTKTIYTNKEEALNVYNKLIKEYYQDEIDMAKDLFGKEINSLEDIMKEIDKINSNACTNEEFIKKADLDVTFLKHNYGIEIAEDFIKCTIQRVTEYQIEYGDPKEKTLEEVYILLEKISANKMVRSYQCLLNNYKDLDNYVKNN